MLITASALLNSQYELIPEAALWIKRNQILYAGPQKALPKEAFNEAKKIILPQTLLCPGLVNAHCHTELSLDQTPPYPGNFPLWIQRIMEIKSLISEQDISRYIQQGSQQLLESGVTCLADHVSFNSDFIELQNLPFRSHFFIEVLGVVDDVAEHIFEHCEKIIDSIPKNTTRIKWSLSPHSVHALAASQFEKIAKKNFTRHSIHLLESAAEKEYFEKNSGPMYDFIHQRGLKNPRPPKSPVDFLNQVGLLNEKLLLIHGNYLSDQEIEILANHQVNLVHCPLSHEYFQHKNFPLKKLGQINIALGTDSLSSAKSISMFDVLRAMQKSYPQLSQKEIFQMATLNGAKALGLENEIGSLTVGKKADVIGVPLIHNQGLENIFQADQVKFSMINGKVLLCSN